MKISLLLCVFFFLAASYFYAQTPYTQAIYSYDSTLNVVYGNAIDYSGNTISLTMDIFKPNGDNNCKRPLVLFLHGGAWAVGSKEDASMQYMAREMAKRGWVAASINYRLGTHKATNYSMNFLCNNSLSEPCAYICDSAEAIRANYRAMQDAKGAVRFMKTRHDNDSSDVDNIFLAGESAGAFTSLLVAYLDRESEKPGFCFAIDDAPIPSSYFDNAACVQNPVNLTRPDLGSVDGNLHMGTYDSKIRGVGSFFGGVFDMNIFEQNNDFPCMYLFAQGSDVIVDYVYGKLFERIDNECYNNFLCQNYANYPHCYGNKGLKQYFESDSNGSFDFTGDIIENYSLNGNCFSNGHQIDNPALRLQNMSEFFAQKVIAAGNNPLNNCISSKEATNVFGRNVCITNSLIDNDIYLHFTKGKIGKAKYIILNTLGQTIFSGSVNENNLRINLNNISSGVYLLVVFNESFNESFKLIKK